MTTPESPPEQSEAKAITWTVEVQTEPVPIAPERREHKLMIASYAAGYFRYLGTRNATPEDLRLAGYHRDDPELDAARDPTIDTVIGISLRDPVFREDLLRWAVREPEATGLARVLPNPKDGTHPNTIAIITDDHEHHYVPASALTEAQDDLDRMRRELADERLQGWRHKAEQLDDLLATRGLELAEARTERDRTRRFLAEAEQQRDELLARVECGMTSEQYEIARKELWGQACRFERERDDARRERAAEKLRGDNYAETCGAWAKRDAETRAKLAAWEPIVEVAERMRIAHDLPLVFYAEGRRVTGSMVADLFHAVDKFHAAAAPPSPDQPAPAYPTGPLTADQQARLKAARAKWDEKLQPLADAYAEAGRITEEDLSLRVTSPGPAPAERETPRGTYVTCIHGYECGECPLNLCPHTGQRQPDEKTIICGNCGEDSLRWTGSAWVCGAPGCSGSDGAKLREYVQSLPPIEEPEWQPQVGDWVRIKMFVDKPLAQVEQSVIGENVMLKDRSGWWRIDQLEPAEPPQVKCGTCLKAEPSRITSGKTRRREPGESRSAVTSGTFSRPIDFTLYCPRCKAWEHGDHAAARLGNATSMPWLFRFWMCFCPKWEPRKYA